MNRKQSLSFSSGNPVGSVSHSRESDSQPASTNGVTFANILALAAQTNSSTACSSGVPSGVLVYFPGSLGLGSAMLSLVA